MNASKLNTTSARPTPIWPATNGSQAPRHAPNQNMEQLGFLAGSIVHDFNNVLSSIMGHVSLALLKLPPEEPARQHVEKALKATEFANILTDQLLHYLRVEQPKTGSVDLNKLVQDTIGLLAEVLFQNIHVHLNLFPTLPLIEAAATEIQQVILNLAVNAAESMDQMGGELQIETGRLAICGNNEIMLLDGFSLFAGEYVYLAVRDTGQGMDDYTLAHIFDPFFSTKLQGGGLGMSIAYDIVRRHNGGIAVATQPSQGTLFTVYLPVTQRFPKYLPIH